ncbi:MAG: SRPBCC family protein [Caulobacteraceae bacterium]|nr:SRPBCC family protein [Caulobacteraceae bacterium]
MRHQVGVDIAADPDAAFAYLSDARNLVSWAFGAMQPLELTRDRCLSRSLVNGAQVEITPRPIPGRREVEFDSWNAGRSDCLVIRASVRPAPSGCRVTLSAERPQGADDEDWRLICAAHEIEARILRTRLEAEARATAARGAAERTPPGCSTAPRLSGDASRVA